MNKSLIAMFALAILLAALSTATAGAFSSPVPTPWTPPTEIAPMPAPTPPGSSAPMPEESNQTYTFTVRWLTPATWAELLERISGWFE